MTLLAVAAVGLAGAAERPNVLFVAIDDLRNELGCLGAPHARTPQLDAFAASARLFTHHYVQAPSCGPSRCALLRGKCPDSPATTGNNAIRDTGKAWTQDSLPGWFRRHGYRTLALGKISHYPGGRTGKEWAEGPEELPGAWERAWIPDAPWRTPLAMMHGYANGGARVPGKTPAWESFDGPDEAYPDAHVAAEAARTLTALKTAGQPWFFAVGFFKPHLPFAAPKRWYDLHDPTKIPSPAVSAKPDFGWHASGEFRGNYGHGGLDPARDGAYARHIRHAYAASASYVDAQVGRVLQALVDQGLAERTVVVVWSDHGFLLGEHAIWGKHCLYEHALRSPLMIRTPGLAQPGAPCAATVESVDLFPTLTDLCGLPSPAGLDGLSLRPYLEKPDAPSAKPARGFWSGGQQTVRTDRWRLIAYRGKKGAADGVELFDLLADPHESRNLAASQPEVVAELGQLLKTKEGER
jgi:iduronate 2-sulfatase